MTRGRAALSVFLVVTMLMSVVAVGFAGTAGADASDELVYGEDATAPIWIDVDTLTVSEYPISEGGTAADIAGYYNDSGDWVGDPVFVVNDSIGEDLESDELGNRNPYSYNPAHIDDEDFGAFPRRGDSEDDEDTDDPASEDNLASALDASEWTKAGQNSSEVTVSDTTVASGVDAVRINTGTSFTSGDVATMTYQNWTDELDSDEEKRVLQLAGDVDTLDDGARVEINVTDESGDDKQVIIDPDATGQNQNVSVAATATGSFVYQIQLTHLTTEGGGTYDNIESINVRVLDGDVDMSLSWIDLESKGKDVLGVEVVDDEDDDDDFDDTNEIYNATGTISVEDLTGLDSEFDDASITDLQYPAKFRVADLKTEGDDEDYTVEWSTSSKYSQPNVLEESYRLELPDAIDLSYSGLDLMMTQSWPEDRYQTLELYEGAGGDNFTDIEDDDLYTSQLSSLGTEDEDVTLDSTVSSGTEYAIHVVSTYKDSETSMLMASGADDDDAAAVGGGGAAEQAPVPWYMQPVNWAITVIGVGVAWLTGVLGWIRRLSPV